MKQDALLKTSSFQGLCLSCACRLAAASITSGGKQSVFPRSARQLSTVRRPNRPRYGNTGSKRWQGTVALRPTNDPPFGLAPIPSLPQRERASGDTVTHDGGIETRTVKPSAGENAQPHVSRSTKRARNWAASRHASQTPKMRSSAVYHAERQVKIPAADVQLDNAVNAVLGLTPIKHTLPASGARDRSQSTDDSPKLEASSAQSTTPIISRVLSKKDVVEHTSQATADGSDARKKARVRRMVLHRPGMLLKTAAADSRLHQAQKHLAAKQPPNADTAKQGTVPSEPAAISQEAGDVLPMDDALSQTPERVSEAPLPEQKQFSPASSLAERSPAQLANDRPDDGLADVDVEPAAATPAIVDDHVHYEQHQDPLTLLERQAAQSSRQSMVTSRSAAAWGGLLPGAASTDSFTKHANAKPTSNVKQVPARVQVDVRPDSRQQAQQQGEASSHEAGTYSQRSSSTPATGPPTSDISQIQSEASALFQRFMQQVIDERRNPPPGARRPTLPRAFDQRRYMSTSSSLRSTQSTERERHTEASRPKFQIRRTMWGKTSEQQLPESSGMVVSRQPVKITKHGVYKPWQQESHLSPRKQGPVSPEQSYVHPKIRLHSGRSPEVRHTHPTQKTISFARSDQGYQPLPDSIEREADRTVLPDTREGRTEPQFTSELAESTSLLSRLSKRFAIDEGAEPTAERQRKRPSKLDTDDRTRRRTSRYDDGNEEDTGRRRRKDVYEDDPAETKRRREKAAEQQRKHREKIAAAAARRAADGKPITIPPFVTVTHLAQLVGAHHTHFSNRLKSLGFDDIFANKVLDAETAALIAQEYGFNPSQDSAQTESVRRDLVPEPEPDVEDAVNLPLRPPVVTIMGHVDHGKTTILDFLRKANVVAGEAGGITQHIGAFSVTLPATRRTITFLDTPGHAAFLAMRQRGANVTDIVVLVVAADDSVMPQTLEAIKHASAAQVPIIVAINKVDKPEANIMKVKQDLGRYGIEIEDFGGDVQVVEVSGKTGHGMAELEEAIVTQAELLDRRADTESSIDGWVVEATTKAAGRVATVLVRRGTIRVGSILVAGRTWCRVRVLRDDAGRELSEAPPGTPVAVDGWREQPVAGDRALEAEDEQQAASVVAYREELLERERLAEDTEAINKARREHQVARDRAEANGVDDAVASAGYVEKETGQQIIPVVIKADVSGSAEAVAAYVGGVGNAMIAPKVLQPNVGAITESDIEYAAAIGGLIIGFNVETEERIKALAAVRKVQILENNIIYRVTEDIREVLESKLAPIVVQKVTGEAEVAQDFEISVGKGKKVKIAGCKVRNGLIARNSRVRVMRDTAKIFDGTLSSLKNVKKDVDEMRKGTECGISFDGWQDFQAGDIVQAYSQTTEKRKL